MEKKNKQHYAEKKYFGLRGFFNASNKKMTVRSYPFFFFRHTD